MHIGKRFSHYDMVLRLAICIFVYWAPAAHAECLAPRYDVGRDFTNEQLGVVSMRISVSQPDLSLANLICLVGRLRDAHPTWQRGAVHIFGSATAARDYTASALELPYEGRASNPRQQAVLDAFFDHRRQLRAIYFFDSATGVESLTITPFGARGRDMGARWDTTITLPLSGRPECRLELTERCVVAIGTLREYPIPYPDDALQARVGGSVVMEATLKPDGTLSDVMVANGATDGRPDMRLAAAAAANLKTWRLEPAPREQTVRITYSYVIDPTLDGHSPCTGFDDPVVHLDRGNVVVEFALPDQVTLRGYPQSPDRLRGLTCVK